MTRTAAIALAVLLALAAVEVDVARSLSITFDERTHIGAGLSYLAHREVLLNPEHPPLVKLVAAAPLAALGAREGSDAARLYERARGPEAPFVQWSYGDQIVWRDNGSFAIAGARAGPDSVTQAARAPLLVLPLALAALVFAWARARFGDRGGLVALGLLLTYPDFLGHSVLVTTDAALATSGVAAAFALDQLGRKGGAGWLASFTLSVAVALASKFSAPAVVAALAMVALVVKRLGLDPDPASLRHPLGRGDARWLAAAVALVAAASYVALWACYLGAEPIGSYRHGMSSVYANHRPDFQVLCLGRYATSFWYYFPVVFALKAPLGTLALLALAAFVARRDAAARTDLAGELAIHLPAAAIVVTVLAFAAPLGTRYLLPAMPFLFVSCGRLATWAGASRQRWAAIALALAANLAGNFHDHPFHTSATNLLAGPPRLVHEWLDDSNQDWGQGLKALAAWQRDRKVDRLVVVTRFPMFDDAILASYGIAGEGHPQDAGPIFAPRRGTVYAISANAMARARLRAAEITREARLSGADPPPFGLVSVEPDELVGGGFLIYDTTKVR